MAIIMGLGLFFTHFHSVAKSLAAAPEDFGIFPLARVYSQQMIREPKISILNHKPKTLGKRLRDQSLGCRLLLSFGAFSEVPLYHLYQNYTKTLVGFKV